LASPVNFSVLKNPPGVSFLPCSPILNPLKSSSQNPNPLFKSSAFVRFEKIELLSFETVIFLFKKKMNKIVLSVVSLALVSLSFAEVQLSDVGVNDDYYLNAHVSFSCPAPPAYAVLPSENSTASAAGDDDYYGAALQPSYAGFVFFYTWMCVFTVFPLLYFAFNNKIKPVGEVKPFLPEGNDLASG
jgi:hypothetical protein